MILSVMATVMMQPPKALVRAYAIPPSVISETYGRGSPAHRETLDSLRKVRELLVELGLVPPPARRLWRALGIWDDRG